MTMTVLIILYFLDGLIDEKSQGITIDLAFKYLNYKDKNIAFIDSPGHEEFTNSTAYVSNSADVADNFKLILQREY